MTQTDAGYDKNTENDEYFRIDGLDKCMTLPAFVANVI